MPEGVSVENLSGTVVDLISRWGMNVIGAIALLIVGFIVAKIVRGWTKRGLQRAKLDATLIPFVSSLAYYAVLLVVGIAVLGLFGIQTASLIAVMGAAAFAVGMALQGTLGNFAAGVMLLIFRPFRVGDLVETADVLGRVKEMGIFVTTIDTLDNVQVIVPNASIFGSVIKNYVANDTRRVDMVFGVSYGDNLGQAKETIERVLGEIPHVLPQPQPTVEVSELGDSSVNFVVRPWCAPEHYWAVWFETHRKVKEGLESAGCSIPFPQRDVHMYQTPVSSNN